MATSGLPTTGTITVDIIDDVPAINVAKGTETGVLLTTQDAQTIGVLNDTDVSTANFSGVFTIGSSSYGADGAGTTTALGYTLNLTVASGTDRKSVV